MACTVFEPMARGRAPQLDARQLAGVADQRFEREPEPGRDGPPEVGAFGRDDVEVRAGAEVDDDRRSSELDASGQCVGEPIGPCLAGPIDLDRQQALQRVGIDEERLEVRGDPPGSARTVR